MEAIKRRMKETYGLSSYQAAQVIFLFQTIGSELSKMVIMGILFHRQLPLYLFALFVMLCLRSNTGGLHFYTYAGCLLTSTLYLALAIYILPLLAVPFPAKVIAVVCCGILAALTDPVLSKYRPADCAKHFMRCRITTCAFLAIYLVLLSVMPENQYLTVGFWVIILNWLQLTVAKIQKKGEMKNDC